MAALFGKPLVVHEQNAIPASPTKCLPESPTGSCALSRSAQRRNLDREPGASGDRGDCNPGEVVTPGAAGPLRILVIGGSLGAKALNDIVPRALSHVPAGGGRS